MLPNPSKMRLPQMRRELKLRTHNQPMQTQRMRAMVIAELRRDG